MAVITDTLSDGTGTAPSRGRYSLIAGATSYEGAADAAGRWSDDIPTGPYQLLEVMDQQSVITPIYVPDSGNWHVSELTDADPTKAIILYGANGSFLFPPAGAVTSNGNMTLAGFAPVGWTFRPGKTIGWGNIASDGTVFFCGQDLGINSYFPTGTTFTWTQWKPGNSLRHSDIPTSLGQTSVTGLNGVVGGAYNADVCTVTIAGSEYVYFLSSHPYGGTMNDWQIATYGEFPMFAAFHKVNGVWTYDPAKSYTPKQVNAASALGALSFPLTTNSFGESYGQDLATDEIRELPASHMLVCPQYFNAPDQPAGSAGGQVFVMDPATGIVQARYLIPFPTAVAPGHANPLAIMVDPTGTVGNETFGVRFDKLGTNNDIIAFFKYDHTGPSITPLTNFLQPTTDTDYGHGCFDDDGWFYMSTGHGLFAGPLNIYPKVDGSWKWAGYPYAYDGTGSLVPITPDFQVPLAGGYASNRLHYDPSTAAVFVLDASVGITVIRKAGDAHAPVITSMPRITPDFNVYVPAANRLRPIPMAGVLDRTRRKIYFPIGQIYTTGAPYPQTPGNLPTYMAEARIDQTAAGPVFISSATGGNASVAAFTVSLPTWVAGDLSIVEVVSNLISTDANIAPSAGWTRIQENSNGTAGMRYAAFYRIMVAGDANPVFTNPRNRGEVWTARVYRGADPTTPINASALTMGAAAVAGGAHTLTRPTVTTSVNGCRIVGTFAGSQVQTAWTWRLGVPECVRAEKDGILGGIGSILSTEELTPQAAAGATTAVSREVSIANLWGAMTIAIAPAATPANPPAVSTVGLVPNPVAHGSTTVCTVTIASAAPAQGCVATVTASNAKATVPFTCFIAAGATTGTVTVNAITAGTVTISAKTVGAAANTVLTIT